MLPPGIRRVPVLEETEDQPGDDGRYIASFDLPDDGGGVRFVVHLPLQDGNPTLGELEELAKKELKCRLLNLAEKI